MAGLLSGEVHSQVNTEAYRLEPNTDGWVNQLSVNSSLNTGNTQFLSIMGEYSAHYVSDDWRSFFVLSGVQKTSGDDTLVNSSFSHLRYIKRLNSHWEWELFVQHEQDENWLLTSRNLFGSGLRLLLTDGVYVGSGLMLEYEQLNTLVGDRSPDPAVRSTTYVSWIKPITHTLNWSGTTYFQVMVNGKIDDFRVLSEQKLSVDISEILMLTTSLTLRYDNDPIDGLKKSDLELTNGVTFVF